MYKDIDERGGEHQNHFFKCEKVRKLYEKTFTHIDLFISVLLGLSLFPRARIANSILLSEVWKKTDHEVDERRHLFNLS